MVIAYVALGSNLGKRQLALRTALARIGALPGSRVLAVARFRETEPEGAPAGSGRFINSAAAVETDLPPMEFLEALLAIERSLGRERKGGGQNEPRTIDLDLLMHGEAKMATATLTLPHPRMHLRRFVIEPLAEIAPGVAHPESGKTMRELLEECERRKAPGRENR
jgi:2-amino-4-hydroxy-6-hydroxymethyldihydropteridine diphosphokinase